MVMPGRLAAVPEESADCSTAAYPPRGLYRDSILRVSVSGSQIRPAFFSHSLFGHSGSSYASDSGASSSCPSSGASNSYASSAASNSYPFNNYGVSSGSALCAATADFGVSELKTIVRRMVSDGYTQRVAQAYQVASLTVGFGSHTPSSMAAPEYGDGCVRVLESWFLELDVAWVLLIRPEHGSQWKLRVQDNLRSSLQFFVERWIRGFTVIVHSMIELVSTRHEITAAARLGEASIFKMLVFVDFIVLDFKADHLRAVLDMYVCVCIAMNNMINPDVCSELVDVKGMLFSLSRSVFKLGDAITSTMEKVMTLIEKDDSWAIKIQRADEVHRNTQWIVDCIVALGEAEASSNYARLSDLRVERDDTIRYLKDLRVDTIRYLKDMLVRKSELCFDPSLRYLFLLNNSYFLAQMIEPCEPGHDWYLTPECKEYMDSYLDVSWGQSSIDTSSVAKFESAFIRTYQAQKFWKVPDPRLRDALRTAITNKVISGYRVPSPCETSTKTVICDYRVYLKKHPQPKKHSSARSISPDTLKVMLGQLFEG